MTNESNSAAEQPASVTPEYESPPPWQRLLRLVGAWISTMPTLSRLLLSIAMVDRKLLSQAPRGEAHVYASLGALMVIAAVWTAAGMATKLSGTVVPSGVFGWLATFGFFFTFALALERSILGTIKASSKARWNIGLRIAMATMLGLLQVTPFILHAFQPRIAQLQMTKELKAVAAAGDLSVQARGVAGIASKVNELAKRTDSAREAMRNPPRDTRVTAAQNRLEKARLALRRAERSLDAEQHQITALRANLAKAKTPAERNYATAQISISTQTIAARTSAVAEVKAAVGGAQRKVAEAQDALAAELQTAVDTAAVAEQASTAQLAAARSQVATDVERANMLATAANSNLAGDLSALLELLRTDFNVAVISAFLLAVALLADLTPLAVKLSLARDGVYACLVEHQSSRTRKNLHHLEELDDRTRERAERLARNETDAVETFTRNDAGALDAARMALDGQQALDGERLLATYSLARSALQEMEQTAEVGQRVKNSVDKDPGLRQMFGVQMASLIAALEKDKAAAADIAIDAEQLSAAPPPARGSAVWKTGAGSEKKRWLS